jgi:hypothetical protein
LLKDYFLKPSDISGNNRQKRLKEFETTIKEKVVSNIDIYFSQKKTEKEEKYTKLAAYFDPDSNRYMNTNDIKICENFIKTLYPKSSKNNNNSTQADINSTQDNQLKPVSILQKFASKLSLDENPIKKKNVLLIDIELQNYKTIINNTTLEFQEFWIEHEKLLPLLYTLAKKVF